MKGQQGSPEAQVKAALTMLSKNIGKVVGEPHSVAALARCNEIEAVVIRGTYCPTSLTGHPDGCRC